MRPRRVPYEGTWRRTPLTETKLTRRIDRAIPGRGGNTRAAGERRSTGLTSRLHERRRRGRLMNSQASVISVITDNSADTHFTNAITPDGIHRYLRNRRCPSQHPLAIAAGDLLGRSLCEFRLHPEGHLETVRNAGWRKPWSGNGSCTTINRIAPGTWTKQLRLGSRRRCGVMTGTSAGGEIAEGISASRADMKRSQGAWEEKRLASLFFFGGGGGERNGSVTALPKRPSCSDETLRQRPAPNCRRGRHDSSPW
jgi:hypothetical protein